MGCQTALQDIAETIDRSLLNRPSDELREFLASLPKVRRATERRQTKRYPVLTDVIVVPLDKDYRPATQPFIACSLNVSVGGMCLYHTEPVESTVLYVEIASPDTPGMSASMRVLRQKRVGRYFEIAGQFLADCPPEADGDDQHRLALDSVRQHVRSSGFAGTC
jgi:hypothetical protein